MLYKGLYRDYRRLENKGCFIRLIEGAMWGLGCFSEKVRLGFKV